MSLSLEEVNLVAWSRYISSCEWDFWQSMFSSTIVLHFSFVFTSLWGHLSFFAIYPLNMQPEPQRYEINNLSFFIKYSAIDIFIATEYWQHCMKWEGIYITHLLYIHWNLIVINYIVIYEQISYEMYFSSEKFEDRKYVNGVPQSMTKLLRKR